MKPQSTMTQFIVSRVREETFCGKLMENPTVLSCGGMYLSRPKRNKMGRTRYDVLALANEDEPTKVFCRHQNTPSLRQVLLKEGMN